MKKIILTVLAVLAVVTLPANEIAVNFIKTNEGFRATTYLCSAGKPTIGYGFTSAKYVNKQKMTEEEAIVILRNYVNKIKEVVNREVTATLTPTQEAVLIDFIFHYGSSAFCTSTLLKYINNHKPPHEIAIQLRRWNKAKVNGEYEVIPGLVARCERRVYLWVK